MIKFIKKHKLNFISYFLCAFAMALFTIISFNCKTYALETTYISSNLFNKDIAQDGYIRTQNGVIGGYSQYCLVDLIEIEDNTTYTCSYYNRICFLDFNQNYLGKSEPLANVDVQSFTTPNNCYFISVVLLISNKDICMLNKGEYILPYQPYGNLYSSASYNDLQNDYNSLEDLYDNTSNQYNDLVLGNNYGYWKYIDYVEFYESNNNIFVPNTDEQNEWSINDLYNNNILKIGGYFDTTPLTMEPYQSNYNEVVSYINFKAYTPSDSFIISFNHSNGCNVVIYDDNSNAFTTTITDSNYLIDINRIRESVPSFSLYVIDMRITPNNAEQNGIYFANNDYITAYNKGYNVATSNADRTYIPQINDLQNQINSLNNDLLSLNDTIDTLKDLNAQYQQQLADNVGWSSLFFAFADTPFKVVSNVLGFELFGLNLFATFIGMITVFGVVYLLKKFL